MLMRYENEISVFLSDCQQCRAWESQVGIRRRKVVLGRMFNRRIVSFGALGDRFGKTVLF